MRLWSSESESGTLLRGLLCTSRMLAHAYSRGSHHTIQITRWSASSFDNETKSTVYEDDEGGVVHGKSSADSSAMF